MHRQSIHTKIYYSQKTKQRSHGSPSPPFIDFGRGKDAIRITSTESTASFILHNRNSTKSFAHHHIKVQNRSNITICSTYYSAVEIFLYITSTVWSFVRYQNFCMATLSFKLTCASACPHMHRPRPAQVFITHDITTDHSITAGLNRWSLSENKPPVGGFPITVSYPKRAVVVIGDKKRNMCFSSRFEVETLAFTFPRTHIPAGIRDTCD